MDHWQALKTELHREAEAIFNSSREVVLFESSSDAELTLRRQYTMLKLTHVPERTAVRWETTKEYGFEAERCAGEKPDEALVPLAVPLQSSR